MSIATATTTVIAAITVGILTAAPAYADDISEVVNDKNNMICESLGKELNGNPANDLGTLVDVTEQVHNFYNISLHDADAVGEVIGKDCPQYKSNVDAATQYAKNNMG